MIEKEPLRDKKHTKDMVVEKLQTLSDSVREAIHETSFINTTLSDQNAIRRRVQERLRSRERQTIEESSDYLTHHSESIPSGRYIKRPKSRSEELARHERAERRIDERVAEAKRREHGSPVTMAERIVYNAKHLFTKK